MATQSERLYARVRSAVESTPAPTTRTRTRILAAFAIVTVLALLAGLALAATLFAVSQGRGGLGIAATWLVSIAALVAPVYAALTVLQPLHSGAADDVASTGVQISP
jgi:hypothetical protein